MIVHRITLTREDIDTGRREVVNTESNWWEVESGGEDIFTLLCKIFPTIGDAFLCVEITQPGYERYDSIPPNPETIQKT
jgi:hypothetical protein